MYKTVCRFIREYEHIYRQRYGVKRELDLLLLLKLGGMKFDFV
jgi:hypothetical protein